MNKFKATVSEVIFLTLLGVFINQNVFAQYFVPSSSMAPTLLPGDRIIAEKISPRFSAIKPGEIGIFKRGKIDLVKRIYPIEDGNKFLAYGDNKKNSYDSRYFGAMDLGQLKARAIFRVWPLNRIGFLKPQEEPKEKISTSQPANL